MGRNIKTNTYQGIVSQSHWGELDSGDILIAARLILDFCLQNFEIIGVTLMSPSLE